MELLLPLSKPIVALKGVCVATSLALMLSGLADVIPMWKTKRVGAKSSTPYVVSLVDSAIGLWFSKSIGDDIGMTLRGLNLVLLAVYIGTFLRFGDTVGVGRASVSALGAIAAVVAGLLAGVKSETIRTDILGLMCTATAIAFAAAPLWDVFRTRNTAAISRPLASALLVCACAWAVYGAVGTCSIWMVIPNVVNAVLAATQLGLSFASPWKVTGGSGARGAGATGGMKTTGTGTGTGKGSHVGGAQHHEARRGGAGSGGHVTTAGQTKATSRHGGANANMPQAQAGMHQDEAMTGKTDSGMIHRHDDAATSEMVGAVAAAGPVSGDVLASAATSVDASSAQGVVSPSGGMRHDDEQVHGQGIRQRRGSTDGIVSPTKGGRRGASPGASAATTVTQGSQPGMRRGTSPRR